MVLFHQDGWRELLGFWVDELDLVGDAALGNLADWRLDDEDHILLERYLISRLFVLLLHPPNVDRVQERVDQILLLT